MVAGFLSDLIFFCFRFCLEAFSDYKNFDFILQRKTSETVEPPTKQIPKLQESWTKCCFEVFHAINSEVSRFHCF